MKAMLKVSFITALIIALFVMNMKALMLVATWLSGEHRAIPCRPLVATENG